MIWGYFSSKGTGKLQVIHGRINGGMYREILEKNLQKSVTFIGHGHNLVLQHAMIPNKLQNLQRNGLKIMVLVLSIDQVSLLTWIKLNICGILWSLKFINGIHKISSNERNYASKNGSKVTLDQGGKPVAINRKRLGQWNKREASQQNI